MSSRSASDGNSAVADEPLALSPGRSQPRPKAPARATALRVPGRDRHSPPGQETVQKALGARIRKLRIKRGLSQKKLAILSGLHRDFVGEIERGRANATLATLAALKPNLGVTVSELFRGIA